MGSDSSSFAANVLHAERWSARSLRGWARLFVRAVGLALGISALPLGAVEPPKAEQLARGIRIQYAHFREAGLMEAINYLEKKAKEQLPTGKSLPIRCAVIVGNSITCTLNDQSLYAVLEEVSKQSKIPIRATDEAIHFDLPAKVVAVSKKHRSREESEIRETLFRNTIGAGSSRDGRGSPVWFFSVLGKDPSDRFMERFAKQRATIRKASQAVPAENRSGVVDKATGKRGVIIEYNEINWISSTRVEVKCGHYEGPENASAMTLKLIHTENGWYVTDSRLDGISLFDPRPNLIIASHRGGLGFHSRHDR